MLRDLWRIISHDSACLMSKAPSILERVVQSDRASYLRTQRQYLPQEQGVVTHREGQVRLSPPLVALFSGTYGMFKAYRILDR